MITMRLLSMIELIPFSRYFLISPFQGISSSSRTSTYFPKIDKGTHVHICDLNIARDVLLDRFSNNRVHPHSSDISLDQL